MYDTLASYHDFATRVMSTVRTNLASAELFSEQDVTDIFEQVEDALMNLDPAHVRISPEAYAARLLQSSALIVRYKPGWRDRH